MRKSDFKLLQNAFSFCSILVSRWSSSLLFSFNLFRLSIVFVVSRPPLSSLQLLSHPVELVPLKMRTFRRSTFCRRFRRLRILKVHTNHFKQIQM